MSGEPCSTVSLHRGDHASLKSHPTAALWASTGNQDVIIFHTMTEAQSKKAETGSKMCCGNRRLVRALQLLFRSQGSVMRASFIVLGILDVAQHRAVIPPPIPDEINSYRIQKASSIRALYLCVTQAQLRRVSSPTMIVKFKKRFL